MDLSQIQNELDLATRLLGSKPDAVLPVIGAGTHRVFRVCTGQRDYALKRYAGAPDDAAQAQQREAAALRFLAAGQLADCVPQLIASDHTIGAALFEWVCGSVPARRHGGEMEQLQRVFSCLLSISRGMQAAEFPAAIGACAKPADLVGQIEHLRQSLRPHEGLARFARILALFDAFWPSARAALLLPQDPARLVLSPVDFGFHKALRRADGRVIFFGFTQFGWDDPARLVADLLWNPALSLSHPEAASLALSAHTVFGACDGGFAQRLSRIWPAIGLCWALRLLNNARLTRGLRVQRLSQDNAAGRQFDRAEICLRLVEESLHEIAA